MASEEERKSNRPGAIGKVVIAVLAITLCVIMTILCSSLYRSSAPQQLRFEICAEKALTVQCQYTAEASLPFSPDRLVGAEITGNGEFEDVSLSIPSTKVQRLRLNLGESPGCVRIRNIRLETDTPYRFSDTFSAHDVDESTIADGDIMITSTQKSPHIIYETAFCTMAERRNIDWYFLLITISISAFISTAVARFVYNYRKSTRQWQEQKGSPFFVLIFCLLLVLPWVDLNRETISVAENRRLASAPRLIHENGSINPGFGKAFDSWLQDHAGFRGGLTSAYFDVKARLSAVRETPRVVMYNNNWMFSKQYHEAAITPFTPEQITTMTANLRRLTEWCAQHNIKPYLLICPTKEMLYADLNTSSGGGDMSTVPNLQQHLSKELPELPVIFPLAAMQEARKTNPDMLLHYKSDSHQTEDGAHLIYAETMRAIQKDFPDVPIAEKTGAHVKLVRNNMVLKRDQPNDNLYYEGGIYKNFDLDDHSVLDTEYNHYENASSELTCTKGNEPMEFHFSYAPGKYKAMLLGDSYSSYQQLWFRYSFSSMWRVRANNGVMGDLMRMSRWENALTQSPPDILIICICSGRLDLHLPALYE